MAESVRVCIVGAGFSGIAAAVSLRRSGITDLVLLERADAVGGTWRDNTYPGCACDVQSRLYELAVAPWPEWSSRFAGQGEIRDYLERVVEVFGLEPHLRLGTTVEGAAWSDAEHRWRVSTTQGEISCEVLISACGGLTEPLFAEVEGVSDFEGTTMHTARWDHGVDLTGRRVAVVGTGASAIQVVPELAKTAAEVVVLQRTPPWIMPRRNRDIPRWYRSALAGAPPLHRGSRTLAAWSRDLQVRSFMRDGLFRRLGRRMALRHLAQQVPDPALRERVTPAYDMGCKRILLSDDYYPALGLPYVTVTSALRSVTAHGVVDADGVEHEVDAIVWATGFKVLDPPLAKLVVGRDGRTLAEAWRDRGMTAYRGTTVAGFPNFYILMGPHTGLGHSSVLLMAEAQVEYIVSAVASGDTLEVDDRRQQEFGTRMESRLAGTVWQTGGCASWYQGPDGRNVALWPGSTRAFRRLMRDFDRDSYRTLA